MLCRASTRWATAGTALSGPRFCTHLSSLSALKAVGATKALAFRGETQVTRILELQAVYPQEFEDDGKGPQAKKVKVSRPSIEQQAYIPRLNRDSSLGLLASRFRKLLEQSIDGVLDLNIVTRELNVSKRRIYDVTNVLEAVHIIKKKTKNQVQWLRNESYSLNEELEALCSEEKKLDRLMYVSHLQFLRTCKDNRRFAYLTYEDIKAIPTLNEQTVLVIKAPEQTKMEVPHPEEKFQIHLRSTEGPIEVFVCCDENDATDSADGSVTADGYGGHSSSPSTGINPSSNRSHLLFHVPFRDYASEVIKSLFGLPQPVLSPATSLNVSIQPRNQEDFFNFTLPIVPPD